MKINPKAESQIIPTTSRSIMLLNKIPGSKDFGKRINLEKLHGVLHLENGFKPSYDKDSNPSLNFLTVEIMHSRVVQGKFWLYSNGTVKTNIGLNDTCLIKFFDYFYYVYGRDVLE